MGGRFLVCLLLFIGIFYVETALPPTHAGLTKGILNHFF